MPPSLPIGVGIWYMHDAHWPPRDLLSVPVAATPPPALVIGSGGNVPERVAHGRVAVHGDNQHPILHLKVVARPRFVRVPPQAGYGSERERSGAATRAAVTAPGIV